MDNKINLTELPSSPKIVFFGTPEFAVPALERLIYEGYDIISVVTQPDRPKGRGRRLTPSPVKLVAEKNSLPILQPERLDNMFLDRLFLLKPDILVVIAFGQIVPKRVLSLPEWGGINIHGSLLPKYRGSAPIQWAIINNDKKTGLTTMHMDEGLDTGPIFIQQEVDIFEGETAGRLYDRLASLAPELLIKTLQGLSNGTVKERAQDSSLSTDAPKLTKDQGVIDWSRTAEQLCGLIRGLDPWPGAFTYYNGEMMKLFECSVVSGEIKTTSTPGRIKGFTRVGLEVETGDGSLTIKEIQVPGKKRMPASEFLKGRQLPVGSILGNKPS